MNNQRKKPSELKTIPEKKLKGLRRFNLIMGFLHLIQGIFMIVVSNDTTYPIFTNYLNFDLATKSLKPNTQLFLDLPFGPAVAVFLLISAMAHFYLSTIGYKSYVENLKKGMNPVRFYEYALSSSWMIVLIGMLIGLWDLGALILIFGLNAMMNLFGIMMEIHNQHTKKTNWTAFIYGCIAGIIPWIVIMMSNPAMPNHPPLCMPSSPPCLSSSIYSPSTWYCNTKKWDAGKITCMGNGHISY